MMDEDLAAGRDKLREIQREAGYDPQAEFDQTEELHRYVELLEATVVGQHAASRVIGSTLRRH